MLKLVDVPGTHKTMVVFPFVIIRNGNAHNGTMLIELESFNSKRTEYYSIKLIDWEVDGTKQKRGFEDEVDAMFEAFLEEGEWCKRSYWETMREE